MIKYLVKTKNNIWVACGLLSYLIAFLIIFSTVNVNAEITGIHTNPFDRNKVNICHVPSGNPENAQTLSINKNALLTHLNHPDDYDGECVATVPVDEKSSSRGILRYANSGNGKYRDRIIILDWKGSSLENGIQNGDRVDFSLPESSCLVNAKLTATFSDVIDSTKNNRIASSMRPTEMDTWSGSSFWNLYDTEGSGEAIYTTEFMLLSGERENTIQFTVNWELTLDGESVAPDLFVIDAEATTEGSESIDVTTNGSEWSVIENAQGENAFFSGYVMERPQFNEVSIKVTQDDNGEKNGWSPLLLSKGMTQTQVKITNYNRRQGKEGVAFALLAPCDRGDAPESYGDAGHAFREKAISPYRTELGLAFDEGTPFLGKIPPDSENQFLNVDNQNLLSQKTNSDDALKDFYDDQRDDDEEGVTIPALEINSQKKIDLEVNGDGYLQAWIDWNADGDFEDEAEQIAQDYATTTGQIKLDVSVPQHAKVGNTYARFRYSSQQGLSSSGYARDGEVEDYQVLITPSQVCSMNKIDSDSYASTSVSANATSLTDETRVYQAKFNSENWQGQLLAYDLKTTDSDGNVKSVVWDAAKTISRGTDLRQRQLFTYNPEKSKNKGIEFAWSELSADQKRVLKNDDNAALAKKRLAWLKGSAEDEAEIGGLRTREAILGDIIHSNIAYLDPLANFGYKKLPGDEGTSYATFLKNKITTKAALFVGANDGQLHALDAQNGNELFAYVPNEVFAKLPKLSDPKYGCKDQDCLGHEYTVDGPITLGDAYFKSDSKWHSVLVAGLGKGGKGIFALDVSETDSFDTENILWEVSAHQSPDTSTQIQQLYQTHMGFSLPAASVVRMRNGKWVALLGNGYGSTSLQATLFIIDIESGELVKAIHTQAGSEDEPNGLSTPIAVDINGDYIVDKIYAGDLLGNLWSFDVDHADSQEWVVSYGTQANPEPLFRACADEACNEPQPITAQPQVGRHSGSGLMVYFGTGRYFDVEDNTAQANWPDSFYGIQDNASQISSRAQLQAQQILQEIRINEDLVSRVTSNEPVDYASKKGWYMDLLTPPMDSEEGERVISQALLREGRLIFTSMLPPQNDCAWGGKSWLMELNAQDGRRLSVIPFDTNNDKKFTQSDNVDYKGQNTIISGVQKPSLGVIFSSPTVLTHTTRTEGKYVSGSEGVVGMFRESASRFSGRMSWQRIR